MEIKILRKNTQALRTTEQETSGTFTLSAYTTSKVINHNLAGTPKVFLRVKGTKFFHINSTNETDTQFTAVSEAPQEEDTEVNWYARL